MRHDMPQVIQAAPAWMAGATCYPLWSFAWARMKSAYKSRHHMTQIYIYIYPHIFGHEICCVPNHFPSISQYPIPVATKQPSSLIFSRRVHHEVCSILMRENPNALRTTRSFVMMKIWVLCPEKTVNATTSAFFSLPTMEKMVAFILYRLYVRLGKFSWMVVKLS